MSFATFSGPIRSGTVREGAGRNVGLMTLTQSATVAATVALTSGAVAQPLFILPAGSKILSFRVEKTVAISGGSVTNVALTLGDGTTADKFLTTANLALAAAPTVQATIDAATVTANTNNIGTTDVSVSGTFVAAGGNPTAGSIVVSVTYVQRGPDGAANPTQS